MVDFVVKSATTVVDFVEKSATTVADFVVKSVAGGELVDTLNDVTVHALEVRADDYIAIYDKNICSICRKMSNVSIKENKCT